MIFAIKGNKIDLVKKDKNVVREVSGLWKNLKETGQEYEKSIRKSWKKRVQEPY